MRLARTLSLIIGSIVLITNCGNIFNPDINDGLPDTSSGQGVFTLHIAGQETQGRTILPGKTENRLEYFRLIFTSIAEDSLPLPHMDIDGNNRSVVLDKGTYNLTVYAYTSSENRDADPHRPAAKGSSETPIVIAPERPAGGTVTLTPLGAVSGGTGTFSWNIGFGFETSNASASMVVTPVSGETPENIRAPVNLLDYMNNEDRSVSSIELPSGFYRVVFTLSQDNDTRPVTWRETLHVFQNMTSRFTHTFSADHFLTRSYLVTFYRNHDDNDVSYLSSASYFFNDYVAMPTAPTRDGYHFGGWFTTREAANAGGDAGKWVSGTQNLNDNLNLFARWNGIPELTSPVTINFGSLEVGYAEPPAIETITITNNRTIAGDITGIMLGGAHASFTWLDDDDQPLDLPLASSLSVAPGVTRTFTVQPREELSVGEHEATITFTYNGGTFNKVTVQFEVITEPAIEIESATLTVTRPSPSLAVADVVLTGDLDMPFEIVEHSWTPTPSVNFAAGQDYTIYITLRVRDGANAVFASNFSATVNGDADEDNIEHNFDGTVTVSHFFSRWSGTAATNIPSPSVNLHDLIIFGEGEVRRGWWTKTLEGSWESGEMVEGGRREFPANVEGLRDVNTRSISVGWESPITDLLHQGRVIGNMRVVRTGENNPVQFRITVSFLPDFDFEGAIVRGFDARGSGTSFTHPISENDSGVPFYVTDGVNNAVIPHWLGIGINIDLPDWSIDTGDHITEPYPVFIVDSNGELEYYWIDEGQGFSSFGPIDFFESYYNSPLGPITKFSNPQPGEEGSIIVRTFREVEGAEFRDDPQGHDLFTDDDFAHPVFGEITVRRNIFVEGEPVGFVYSTLLGASVDPVTGEIGSGTANVEFQIRLDNDFAQFVQSYILGSMSPVERIEGGGIPNPHLINVSGLSARPSPILPLVFTFVD